MKPAIRVENLSKQYRIGKRSAPGMHNLTESIAEGAKGLWHRLTRPANGNGEDTFWALKDLSFEVQPGEIVGIIGRNGAGKSTLLKILSQIVEPTSGRVKIRGRMASLLEVGTGFHPELTGRENIYMNGCLLGLKKWEIDRKFDDIVAFSEIERFLDTPVKRYSSGMYVRLAFAVAAHLEPEILVVDEVLAVGDAQFQNKCLGKMGSVAQEGRTVLFVSHNLAALQHLCQSAMILEKGLDVGRGPAHAMVAQYLRGQEKASKADHRDFSNRTGNGRIVFTAFHVEDSDGHPLEKVQSGQDITLVFGYRCPKGGIKKSANVGFGLHASTGERLTILYASHTGQELSAIAGCGEFRCRVPRFPFNPGRYYVFSRIEVNGIEADFPRNGVGYIDVEAGDFYKSGRQTCDQGYAPYLISATWLPTTAAKRESSDENGG